MSVRVLTWAWSQPCDCPSEKLVLLALADHAGEDGTAHPGTGSLAVKTGMSVRQVGRHLGALEERGLLERKRPRLRSGRLGTYRYQILTDDRERPVDTDDQWTPTSDGSDQDIREESPPARRHPRPVVQATPVSGVIEPSVREPSKPLTTTMSTSARGPVERVFAAWQEATGHPKAVLDPKRRRLISDFLKHYSVEDLEDACHGITLSAFHMGQNDRGERYDKLSNVLKSSGHVEQFRDLARDGPPTPPLRQSRNAQVVDSVFDRIHGGR